MVKYDPLDCAAARHHAISFWDHVSELIEARLAAPGLADRDRPVLEYAKDSLYAFGELEKHFIAPLGSRDLDNAARGYVLFSASLTAAFIAGSYATLSETVRIYANKKAHATRSSSGGTKGGKTRRESFLGSSRGRACEGHPRR